MLEISFSLLSAIYSGDYSMCELSDSDDTDADIQEIGTHDITMTPPQQTSEKQPPQQQQGDVGDGGEPGVVPPKDIVIESNNYLFNNFQIV